MLTKPVPSRPEVAAVALAAAVDAAAAVAAVDAAVAVAAVVRAGNPQVFTREAAAPTRPLRAPQSPSAPFWVLTSLQPSLE
jgi:hypothetical protein